MKLIKTDNTFLAKLTYVRLRYHYEKKQRNCNISVCNCIIPLYDPRFLGCNCCRFVMGLWSRWYSSGGFEL